MKTTLKAVVSFTTVLWIAGVVAPTPMAADTVIGPSPMQRMVSGMNPANWTMPQWRMPDFKSVLPGQDEKARIKKKKDGLFTEVGETASNSWTKTKQVLNPARMFPASSRSPAKATKEEKPGFFRWLFTPEPEEKEVSTVTDFLRQSRPSP